MKMKMMIFGGDIRFTCLLNLDHHFTIVIVVIVYIFSIVYIYRLCVIFYLLPE